MKQNYQAAIDFIFKYEGGYVNHPQDPGGPTNRGITLKTARAFWKKDATAEDVKTMPKSVAEDIYRKQYAEKIGFDTLPSGIDFLAFDAAVLSGPAKAKTWLTAKTIDEFQAKRLAFYQSLKIWPTFGKGWTNRLDAGTKIAKTLDTKPTSTNTKVAIGTAGAVVLGTTQVPSHWWDQLFTVQSLVIGASVVLVGCLMAWWISSRYRVYKKTKA